jgi:hypothetical protein
MARRERVSVAQLELLYCERYEHFARVAAAVAGDGETGRDAVQIAFANGRDVTRDPSRSWVSPSCSSDGSTLIAAASRNLAQTLGREHRAIWELRPARRQLTHPPADWTDENPHVLSDGSILFVRTRLTSRRLHSSWYLTEHGELERLAKEKLTEVANVTFTLNELSSPSYDPYYYGHYGWPWRVVVAP